MKAIVTNIFGKDEIHVMMDSLGVSKLDYSKLGDIQIKKGDGF